MKFWPTLTAFTKNAGPKAQAIALAKRGRLVEAVAAATALNRVNPDEELERLLVDWRLLAMDSKLRTTPSSDWQQGIADPFPSCRALPEIQAAELTAPILAGAIVHHGGLLVRGLISSDDAASFRAGMEQARAGFGSWLDNSGTPPSRWFCPVRKSRLGELAATRRWLYSGGCTWAADSPRMLFETVELLERTKIIAMVSEYFIERPALSVGKTTLRKVSVTQNERGWHQDGRFLSTEVRSVNLWVALSDCGHDAAGIDLVPKRIPYIVESGTQGAEHEWMVAPSVVDQVAGDTPVCSPSFAAGDALLFDHFFLHRTSFPEGRTKDRYALECWMFAPSCFPTYQRALLL